MCLFVSHSEKFLPCVSLCFVFSFSFFNLDRWRPLPAICCMALHHNPCASGALSECGLLYIAVRRDYTAVSAPVCRIGLLLLQGSCSRLPVEVSNSPYHFPDDALGRINSGGGRMLFTCRFLLSHLRQTTPALPSPFSPNMVRMSERPRPCSLSGRRSASPDEMRL